MTRRVVPTVAALAVTLLSAATAGAAPGALDPGYGAGGVATINAGTEPTAATALTTRVGGDGRLYTAALSGDGSRFVARVEARSATTGAIDPGFAAGGRNVRLRGDAQPIGLAVSATAPTTVHLGLVGDDVGVPVVAIARLTAQGALDPTYGGGDGIATLAVPNLPSAGLFRDGLQSFAGVAGPLVLGDGRAYLVLARINGTDTTTIVVRFTAAGLPDTAFGGGDGIVELPGLTVNDLAAPANGASLYLAGSTLAFGGTLSLVRLTAAGALDPAFAGGRVNTAVPTSSSSLARGVFLTGSDVTIVGQASVVGGNAVVIARYDLAGAPTASSSDPRPAASRSAQSHRRPRAVRTGSPRRAPAIRHRW